MFQTPPVPGEQLNLLVAILNNKITYVQIDSWFCSTDVLSCNGFLKFPIIVHLCLSIHVIIEIAGTVVSVFFFILFYSTRTAIHWHV